MSDEAEDAKPGDYQKNIAALTAALTDGPQPLTKLPQHLRSKTLLTLAANAGKIGFGRPNHGFERYDRKEAEERQKNGELDPFRVKTPKLVVYSGIDWMEHKPGTNFTKTVAELLAEEAAVDEKIRLHVRLL